MVDTVNTSVLYSGERRYVAHFTNESDGTGEAAVDKINVPSLTGPNGGAATYSTVEKIEYSVSGFNYVTVEWDATTNDEIAVLKGQGMIDWTDVGGKTDPQSAGGDGQIAFTTDGAIDGASYDITIWMRQRD